MSNSLSKLRRIKFLVLGSNGQLGKEFSRLFDSNGISFRAYDIDTVDVSDIDSINNSLKDYLPSIILNCAAYNLVDKAESDLDNASKANALGAKNIAILSSDYKIKAVHYSTDYVFDGTKGTEYLESDTTAPLNNYGKTKLEGEKLFAEHSESNLLFRLSWVYGNGNQNFIYKLINWAETQDILKISTNEVSVPTSTNFVASMTLEALAKQMDGLYHLCPESYASRFEWANEVLLLKGINKQLVAATIEEFNLPAKRPEFSAMSAEMFAKDSGLTLDSWLHDLSKFFKNNH